MRTRFEELCRAAALAADCTVEVVFSGHASTMRNNMALANRFGANLAAYGVVPGPQPDNLGSSDMGDVSQVCRRSIRASRSARPACPATRSSSGMPRPRRMPTR